MGKLCFYIFTIVLLGDINFILSFSNSEFMDENDFRLCVCVPYWLCKEDYSGLIEDGIDLMDIRKNKNNTVNASHCTGYYDVCCKVECGMRRTTTTGVNNRQLPEEDEVFGFRILGEHNEAEFGEFPWMLGVLEDKTYRCGASLIHPQVALTAAHCLTGKGRVKVRAGEWNWAVRTEALPHQDRFAKKVLFHPQYHEASLRNDIALIILETPFKLTENVGIICLPPTNEVLNRGCIASGWGKNSFKRGTYQSTLKKISLPMVPRDRCVQILRQAGLGPYFNLHRSFICAGGENNKDTCKGDGGSPLICPIADQPGRYEQIGIVSWGLTCGLQNTPGVYVNIGLFRDWIDYTMEQCHLDTSFYRY